MKRERVGQWLVCLGLLGLMAACADEVANTPPEFVGLDPEYRVSVGETLTINVSAKDADGDNVSLSMESGPPGSDFIVSGFGRFVWTPEAQDADTPSFNAVFLAQDDKGARTTFRTSIQVSASTGEVRFTTSNSRVLDLTRNTELVARVAVQREDVTEVNFGLENQPQGMTLTQSGGKSAELRWSPSQEQIASKLIWGATISAGATDGIDALQNLTLTLVAKACGEGATEVEHAPLGDQRGGGDYAIEAQVVSPDGSPVRATLFSRLGGDPNDSGGFDGQPMENTGGTTYRAVIRNPGAIEGQPKDVYYFIVATSDADRSLGCLARAPETGLNSFAAFAPGDESCRRDQFEPNDDTASAAVLAEDTQGINLANGQLEAFGLAICNGEKDFYAIDLNQNQGVSVLITYNSELGDMHLRGIGPDGTSVVLESTDMFLNESSMLLPAAADGRYFIEVSGADQGYRMQLSLRDDVDPDCIDTQFEPNEFATQAPILPPGTYEGLQVCPGDKEFFGVSIPTGFTLNAQLIFSHADGDLDFVLRDRNERPVATSGSSTDNELIVHNNAAGPGTSFTLEVRPVNGAVAPYDLILELTEEDVNACQPDFFETNDTPEDADRIPIEGNINGSTVSMCGDDDYYAVHLGAGDEVTASITFSHETADLDMELLDPSRTVKATSAGVENQEQYTYTATVTGNHYVRVFRYEGDNQEYLLTIQTGGDDPNNRPSDCNADDNEENGARAFSQPLDEAQTSNVGLCGDDIDFFVLFPNGGQTILATLSIFPIDGGNPSDVAFDLLNNDDEVLAGGQSTEGGLQIEFEADSADPHFLRVQNNGSEGFIYNLEAIIL